MLNYENINAQIILIDTLSKLTQEEIISQVRKAFEVIEVVEDAYVLEFKIQKYDFKAKFADLAQRLEEQSIVCELVEKNDGLYLIVKRIRFGKQGWLSSSALVPKILFAIVVAFVMIDGHFRTVSTNEIIQIGDPVLMAVIYTVALLGILGVHEIGHLVASKIHKIKTTMPYFIPGLPIIGIPTFGALIMAKGLMINREKAFDVAIAGPIAGLAIAVIVALYGAATVPIIDHQLSELLHHSGELTDWQFGESLLMKASLALFDKGGDTEILMTPVLFAAWIGFFLTFANLMPAGQLDGGHLIRTMFGKKVLRIATYVSAAILFLMNFWFVALFILFMSRKNSGINIMDDITPLSPKRKISYVLVMILAVLCAPIPDNFTLIEPLLHLIPQIPSA